MNPGPGSYERPRSKGNAFSFRGKHLAQAGKSALPGPGNYESTVVKDFGGPKYSFGAKMH
jgi:hypothetical protein